MPLITRDDAVGIESPAVVSHLQGDGPVGRLQGHPRLLGTGVLHDLEQRLPPRAVEHGLDAEFLDIAGELLLDLVQQRPGAGHVPPIQLQRGPGQEQAKPGQPLDGPVVQLGGDSLALLLGGADRAVEQAAPLRLRPLELGQRLDQLLSLDCDLPDQSTHPGHDQEEQNGRGRGRQPDVDVPAAQRLDHQRGRSHQRGRRQDGDPARTEALSL